MAMVASTTSTVASQTDRRAVPVNGLFSRNVH
jgi:hypothetical protein